MAATTEARALQADRPRVDWSRLSLLLLLPTPAISAVLSAAVAFRDRRALPLEPDVRGYVELARHFGLHSLGASVREPVWPAVLVAPVRLSDADPDVLHGLGLIVFPLLVVAFQLLAGRYVGRALAWVAALLLAASPWLAWESVRVLRELPAATIVLTFLYVASRPGDRRWRGWATLGALAGVAALTRWDTTLITLPALLLLAWTHAERRRTSVAAFAVFGAMVTPLLAGNAIEFGDPFHHSNIHASFYRNYEFAGRPGHPSIEQVRENPYVPTTNWAHYLFVDRRPTETVRRIPAGGADIVADAASYGIYGLPQSGPDVAGRQLYWLLLGAAAYGGLVLLRERERERERACLLPVVTVLAAWAYSPISGQFDFRMAVLVYPMLLLLATVGIADLAPRLLGLLDQRRVAENE